MRAITEFRRVIGLHQSDEETLPLEIKKLDSACVVNAERPHLHTTPLDSRSVALIDQTTTT